MPRTRSAYAPEFRRQMVGLVRAGRSREQLAKEFEPSSHPIRHWVRVAAQRLSRNAPGMIAEGSGQPVQIVIRAVCDDKTR